MESLPRPVSRSTRPESGRCAAVTLSTSAPCSASVRAQVGPASTRVRSSTRTPASGRDDAGCDSGSGSGGASPMRTISRQRMRGDRRSLRMQRPFLAGPHQPGASARRVDCVFERKALPRCARLHRRLAIRRRAEHLERGFAVVGEIAVDAHPPAIAHRVEAGESIPGRRQRLAVDPHVARAAQRSGGRTGVDRHLLGAFAAQGPQVARGEARCRERGRAGRGEAVARREHRVVAGDLHLAGLRRRETGERDQVVERGRRHLHWFSHRMQAARKRTIGKRQWECWSSNTCATSRSTWARS